MSNTNTILLKDPAPLLKQAQTHNDVADRIQQIMSAHAPRYESFVFAADTSGMPDLSSTYSSWWLDHLSPSFEAHSHAHQNMGQNLLQTTRDYQTLDKVRAKL
jgi:hypothetical protein